MALLFESTNYKLDRTDIYIFSPSTIKVGIDNLDYDRTPV